MAIDFPNSPAVGEGYTVGDKSWVWNGTIWTNAGSNSLPVIGDQSGIQTEPTSHPTYTLQYEFNESTDLDDAIDRSTSGSTFDPVIGNGVLSIKFGNTTSAKGDSLVWANELEEGEALETCVSLFSPPENYWMAGLVLSDGAATTDDSLWILVQLREGTSTLNTQIYEGTPDSISGWLSGTENDKTPAKYGHPFRLRVYRSAATTYEVQYSIGGVHWSPVGWDFTGTWAITPSYVGVAVTSWGNSKEGIATFDYLRKYTV